MCRGLFLIGAKVFCIDRRAQLKSPGTIQYYTNKLRGFVKWCNMRQLINIEEITPKDMRDFLVYLQFNHNRVGDCRKCDTTLRLLPICAIISFGWY